MYWFMDEQVARLQPYFPESHGKPRVDERRVLSDIVFVNRNGLDHGDQPIDAVRDRPDVLAGIGLIANYMCGMTDLRNRDRTCCHPSPTMPMSSDFATVPREC
jgi:hypothetical protein